MCCETGNKAKTKKKTSTHFLKPLLLQETYSARKKKIHTHTHTRIKLRHMPSRQSASIIFFFFLTTGRFFSRQCSFRALFRLLVAVNSSVLALMQRGVDAVQIIGKNFTLHQVTESRDFISKKIKVTTTTGGGGGGGGERRIRRSWRYWS